MDNEEGKNSDDSSNGPGEVSQIDPVSPKEMAVLADGVRYLRDRAIMLFLMDTGLRANELVLLDLDSIKLYVRKLPGGGSETIGSGSIPFTRSGNPREFSLSSRAAEALRIYWSSERRYDTCRVLFASRSGGRLLPRLISIIVREWCDRLGIGRIRLLEFRRSLVRRLFDPGGSLHPLAIALGYTNR